ncbi:MAG: hypothetical protein WCW16_05200 [Candidatus Magasanikbacteria bacterium]
MLWGAIILVVALGVGGYLFFVRQNNSVVDKDQETNGGQEVSLPEGVSIIEEDGNKKLVNNIDNYSVRLESDFKSIEYKNGLLVVTNQAISDNNELDYRESYNISLLDLKNSSLEDWVLSWISQQEYGDDYSYEKKLIGDKEVYIINVPSYADNEKILIYKYENKVVFVDSIFGNPMEIFNNMTFR